MLAGYVASLAALLMRLHGEGVATQYATLDGQDLMMQRNVLTERFLASDCTHLLFIDSDMLFPDDLASTLLALDKSFVGIVYTRRALNLARFKALAPERGFDAALALAHDWNLRPLGAAITVQSGLARVEGLGGGFLLMRRAVFERMLAAGRMPVHEAPPSARPVRAFFHETREADQIFDCDYSFCRRWIALGGDVWAYVGAEVRHIGDWHHGPSFAAFLHAQKGSGGEPRV